MTKRILLIICLFGLFFNGLFAQYNSSLFTMEKSKIVDELVVDQHFTNTHILPLNKRQKCYGISISGEVHFADSIASYLKIIVEDSNGREHLVCELYPLICDSLSIHLHNVAMESRLLQGVVPIKIKIECTKTNLYISEFQFNRSSAVMLRTNDNSFRQQKEQIVYLLNKNLSKRNMPWRAGVTTLSLLPQQEKEQMLGSISRLMPGFEFYKGGVYSLGNASQPRNNNSFDYSSYSDIDWRNRFNKNWVTVPKNQRGYTCWAFGAASLVESYINRYYNNSELNYDLSEQHLYNECHHTEKGGYLYAALDFVRDNGILLEDCLPFTLANPSPESCSDPTEKIKIEGYSTKYIYNDMSQVYHDLLNAPLAINFFQNVGGHSVLLVGKKTLKANDVIYRSPIFDKLSQVDSIVVNEGSDLIGATVWIMKNSYGEDWGENGFCNFMISDDLRISSAYAITGCVRSLMLSDSDIQVEDKDGDGYFCWGGGPRPNSLPIWANEFQDADDENPLVGTFDDYGFSEEIHIGNLNIIDSTLTLDKSEMVYDTLNVGRNGLLEIKDIIPFHPNSKLVVDNMGTVIIDGATIKQAQIHVKSGGHLVIKNNGLIERRKKSDLIIDNGAVLELFEGVVL